jgi:hypothetical protein
MCSCLPASDLIFQVDMEPSRLKLRAYLGVVRHEFRQSDGYFCAIGIVGIFCAHFHRQPADKEIPGRQTGRCCGTAGTAPRRVCVPPHGRMMATMLAGTERAGVTEPGGDDTAAGDRGNHLDPVYQFYGAIRRWIGAGRQLVEYTQTQRRSARATARNAIRISGAEGSAASTGLAGGGFAAPGPSGRFG